MGRGYDQIEMTWIGSGITQKHGLCAALPQVSEHGGGQAPGTDGEPGPRAV
jgi:hypothetical protein